jgi:DNA helicase-2/ATP-dependent DNA helicase PcrA
MKTSSALKETDELNKEQRRAVEHGEGPLLIIAGAGTGKTKVITHRIARLIEKGVKPDSILALTFTEKAAGEMEERVDMLVPYGYSSVWISTFHAFGDRILRDNALSVGLTPDFKVLGEPQCVIFLRENLFSLPLERFRPLGDPTRYISALVKFIARLKDEAITVDEYRSYCESLKVSADTTQDYILEQTELAASYAAYSELMAKKGFIDFADQVAAAVELFRSRPAALRRYREKFSYILVDEFQDTNYAQFELIKLLTQDRRNLTVVADDDQSIYKFRGAAISNVLNFKKFYPEAAEVTLTQNYRSAQPILDAAYRLITHNNPDRLEVKCGINKKLLSVAGRAGFVRHIEFDVATLESDWVAKTIEEKIATGRKPGDFAILVRANSDARPFLLSLFRRGIPYRFSGGSGLYSREEISLLISFLRAVTDHTDNFSHFDLSTSPIYGLKDTEIIPCHNAARRSNRTLLSVMKEPGNVLDIAPEGIGRIKKFVQDIDRYSDMSLRSSPARIIYAFLTESGHIAALTKEGGADAEEKIRNIAKFFDIVTEMEETLSIRNVHSFVEHLNLLRECGDDPAPAEPDFDEDCVHVLTVHKAKGLEFPVVFMVGLAGDRFPRRDRREELPMPVELIKDTLPSGDFHLEEERRLFYVGMTRAMEELYLTNARDCGGKRLKKISRFIVEAVDVPRAEPLKIDPVEAVLRHGAAPVEKRPVEPLPPETELRLSHYQIDDYLTCPRKYHYAHVLRFPLLPHHSITYGKAAHDALAFYFRKKMEGIRVAEDEVVYAFKNSWRSEGFISREHEEKRFAVGVEALKRFIEGENIVPACVERDFAFTLGADIVRGRWDLIEERDGGPCIIDFKTSDVRDKKKADERAYGSVQLRLYSLGYYKNFGRLPASCELHFVESRVVGEAAFDNTVMEETAKTVEEASAGIRKREFGARPRYMNCNYCPFNGICENRYGG